MSEHSSSPVVRPLITVVLDCEPELPPVSNIMGINVTSSGIAEIAASNFPKIEPVIVPAIMSMRSQIIRFFTIVNTLVLRYGVSRGCIAAICSISFVASSSMTSTISSTVTIPTSLFSLSTTGSVVMSYFENIPATVSLSSVVTALTILVSIMSEICVSSFSHARISQSSITPSS